MTIPETSMRDIPQFPVEDGDSLSTAENISPFISDAILMRNIWDSHLTHQMRVLLYTEPLLRVLRRDEYRSEEREHYDSLALALKLLDHIVTNTGLEHEADSDTAIHDLLPLMEAMDQAANVRANVERRMQMAKTILGDLRNDKEGQHPFKRAYTDFASGHAVQRELAIRLIEERHTARGDIVLHLSNEAANLLLNALAYDIEDAQAAAEAVVQSQLRRGHLQDAINSAQVARWQSNILRGKMEQLLSSTRRDLSHVDWKQEVPRILEESLIHLESRCDVEHNIIKSAREKQDALVPGSEEAYHLTKLISIISDCRRCHMELQQQLMEAPQVFLDEQERQVFALRRRFDLPDMRADVLAPLLGMHRIVAEQALPTIFADWEQYEHECSQLLDHWTVRKQQVETALASIGEFRQLTISHMLELAHSGIELLKKVAKRSKLPPSLPDFQRQPFLKIILKDVLNGDEQRAKIDELLERCMREGTMPSGLALLQRAVRCLASPIRVEMLFPDPNHLRYVPVAEIAKESGGERLTSFVLLYCSLVQLRATERTKHADASSTLILDNPYGAASLSTFLELQREVAQSMHIQLIYTTGIHDIEAIRMISNVVRLRNDSIDRKTGEQLLQLDTPHQGLQAMRVILPTAQSTPQENGYEQ